MNEYRHYQFREAVGEKKLYGLLVLDLDSNVCTTTFECDLGLIDVISVVCISLSHPKARIVTCISQDYFEN